jgi:hypothetical protein
MAHSGGEKENRLVHGMQLIPARERNWGATTLGIVTLGTHHLGQIRASKGRMKDQTRPWATPLIRGVVRANGSIYVRLRGEMALH